MNELRLKIKNKLISQNLNLVVTLKQQAAAPWDVMCLNQTNLDNTLIVYLLFSISFEVKIKKILINCANSLIK